MVGTNEAWRTGVHTAHVGSNRKKYLLSFQVWSIWNVTKCDHDAAAESRSHQLQTNKTSRERAADTTRRKKKKTAWLDARANAFHLDILFHAHAAHPPPLIDCEFYCTAFNIELLTVRKRRKDPFFRGEYDSGLQNSSAFCQHWLLVNILVVDAHTRSCYEPT